MPDCLNCSYCAIKEAFQISDCTLDKMKECNRLKKNADECLNFKKKAETCEPVDEKECDSIKEKAAYCDVTSQDCFSLIEKAENCDCDFIKRKAEECKVDIKSRKNCANFFKDCCTNENLSNCDNPDFYFNEENNKFCNLSFQFCPCEYCEKRTNCWKCDAERIPEHIVKKNVFTEEIKPKEAEHIVKEKELKSTNKKNMTLGIIVFIIVFFIIVGITIWSYRNRNKKLPKKKKYSQSKE